MKYDNIILAENCVYSMDSHKTQLNNNVMVVGSSGSGKTTSVTEPMLLTTANTSLIVTLSKRRLINLYRPLMTKRGYDVEILDFARPETSPFSFDPLAYVKSYKDVVFLAEAIIKSNPRKENTTADPYWDDCSISLLAAEIGLTMFEKKKPTFADVLHLHDSLEIRDDDGVTKTSLDGKFAEVISKNPGSFVASCWRSFVNTPIRTMRCVFSTMNTVLDTLFTPELRKMLDNANRVNFTELSSKKTVLFVLTSPVSKALYCFVNLFYATVFKELFEIAEKRRDTVLPLPVHILCDDFAVGCKIPNFTDYIAIIREKRISTTILLQSESQLEAMYGFEEATTIRNNCDSFVYLGGMDLQSAKDVSERLNVPLEDVLYMPIGQAVVFRRGEKPIITQRYNTPENEIYRKLHGKAKLDNELDFI